MPIELLRVLGILLIVGGGGNKKDAFSSYADKDGGLFGPEDMLW
jgi:hypothetical protein